MGSGTRHLDVIGSPRGGQGRREKIVDDRPYNDCDEGDEPVENNPEADAQDEEQGEGDMPVSAPKTDLNQLAIRDDSGPARALA